MSTAAAAPSASPATRASAMISGAPAPEADCGTCACCETASVGSFPVVLTLSSWLMRSSSCAAASVSDDASPSPRALS